MRLQYLLVAILVACATASMQLGQVINVNPIPCPSGYHPNAVCSQGTVTGCPNTLDQGVIYGWTKPRGQDIRGTIVLHGGGGGAAPIGSNSQYNFADAWVQAGFQVVQMQWVRAPFGWEDTGLATKNIREGGCYPATLYWYLHDLAAQQNHNSRKLPYCSWGHSGGSAAIGYTLAHYNGEEIFDKVIMSAGPVFGGIHEGCQIPQAPTIQLCPPGQAGCDGQPSFDIAPIYPGFAICARGAVTYWTGHICGCPGTPSTADQLADWKNQSIVTDGADFTWPNTAVTFRWCGNSTTSTNCSPAQGQIVAEAVAASDPRPLHLRVVVATDCDGAEDNWTGTPGFDDIISDMTDQVTGCVLHHQDDD